MPIMRYKKIQDEYTTYRLIEPEDIKCTELCTLNNYTYVHVPEDVVLPTQHSQITIDEVTLTDELKAQIKSSSKRIKLINERVVIKIREKYSLNDEICMNRLRDTQEFSDYNTFVESCILWGMQEKIKIGL